MIRSTAGLVFLASCTIFGQAPAFEVASIKPGRPGDVRGSTFQFTPGGGLQVTNGTLKGIIETAYDVRDFQISGAQGWLNSDRYDISARNASGDPGIGISDTRQKLQTLLSERFKLKVRRETRELPVYALTVGKNGSKLTGAEVPNPAENSRPGIRTGCGQMTGAKASMANLVVMLARNLNRPVLDRTSLTGKYDFQLDWTPDAGPCSASTDVGSPGAAARSSDGASIFTALQEELGLKLESTKGPVEIIVVEHAEKPDDN